MSTRTRLTLIVVTWTLLWEGVLPTPAAEAPAGRRIVVLADRSGSMSKNNRIDYLRFGIQTLLAFCSENDTITVLPFANLQLGTFESKVNPDNISAFFETKVKDSPPQILKWQRDTKSNAKPWPERTLKEALIIAPPPDREQEWGTALSDTWRKLPGTFAPPAGSRILILLTDAEELHDVGIFKRLSDVSLDLDGYYALVLNMDANLAEPKAKANFDAFWGGLIERAKDAGNRFEFKPEKSTDPARIQETVRAIAAKELAWLEYPHDKIKPEGTTEVPLPGLARSVTIIAWGSGVDGLSVNCGGAQKQPQFEGGTVKYRIFRFKKEQFDSVALDSRANTTIRFFADFNFFIVPEVSGETVGNRVKLHSMTKAPLRVEFREKTTGKPYDLASRVKSGEIKVTVKDSSGDEVAVLEQISGSALKGEFEPPFETRVRTNYELQFKVTFKGQQPTTWDLPAKSLQGITVEPSPGDVRVLPPGTKPAVVRVGQTVNVPVLVSSTFPRPVAALSLVSKSPYRDALDVGVARNPEPLIPGTNEILLSLTARKWMSTAANHQLNVSISHSLMRGKTWEVSIPFLIIDDPLISSSPMLPASQPGRVSAGAWVILNRTGSAITLEATLPPVLRGPSNASLSTALFDTGLASGPVAGTISLPNLPPGETKLNFPAWKRADFRGKIENYALFGTEFVPGVYRGEIAVRCAQLGFQAKVLLQIEVQDERLLARTN